jgi:glycosyltransferase involved in cell wall biosynthesis
MEGRPERAQPNFRLVRRAQPRASRSPALPLTVSIVVVTVFARERVRSTYSWDAITTSYEELFQRLARRS